MRQSSAAPYSLIVRNSDKTIRNTDIFTTQSVFSDSWQYLRNYCQATNMNNLFKKVWVKLKILGRDEKLANK